MERLLTSFNGSWNTCKKIQKITLLKEQFLEGEVIREHQGFGDLNSWSENVVVKSWKYKRVLSNFVAEMN